RSGVLIDWLKLWLSPVEPAAGGVVAIRDDPGQDRQRDLLRAPRADVDAHRGADPPEDLVTESHPAQLLDVRADVPGAAHDADESGGRPEPVGNRLGHAWCVVIGVD